jgi:hypothetical protein
MSASSKEEFVTKFEMFVSKDLSRPVVFECFTSSKDESDAYSMLYSLDVYDTQSGVLPKIKGLVPNRIKNAAKVLLGE